jgi:DNA-binding response OmpR family regulator
MDTTASILAIDDELYIIELIKRALGAAGYQVLTAHDGLQALKTLQSRPVDLILADIAMPRMNGYQLHEKVIGNPEWVNIPFVFLTARAKDSDIRYGKELGVDDYLTKPFAVDDLLAAVRGKLKRAQQLAGSSAQGLPEPRARSGLIAVGELRIDHGQHRVWLNGNPVRLSAREFRLLECLARRPEVVVPLQELIRATHQLDTNQAEASGLLRPLIRSLRRKLGYPTGELGCIQSVRGVGYRLIPPSSQGIGNLSITKPKD